MSVTPASAQIYFDDVAMANPFQNTMQLDAKSHTLRAVAPGYVPGKSVVLLEKDVDLKLALKPETKYVGPPVPAAASATKHEPGIVDEY